jgi:hypothetical protein
VALVCLSSSSLRIGQCCVRRGIRDADGTVDVKQMRNLEWSSTSIVKAFGDGCAGEHGGHPGNSVVGPAARGLRAAATIFLSDWDTKADAFPGSTRCASMRSRRVQAAQPTQVWSFIPSTSTSGSSDSSGGVHVFVGPRGLRAGPALSRCANVPGLRPRARTRFSCISARLCQTHPA